MYLKEFTMSSEECPLYTIEYHAVALHQWYV